MTANQAIVDAIREVQSFVSADGADLKLIDCNDERKHLRLRPDARFADTATHSAAGRGVAG
jgi:hypothetical protein